MKVELVDRKLVLSSITAEGGRAIFALAAAWKAFENFRNPITDKAVRYKEGRIAESKIEIVNNKLFITPLTAEEERTILALYAAWTAFEDVLYPKDVIRPNTNNVRYCRTESTPAPAQPDPDCGDASNLRR